MGHKVQLPIFIYSKDPMGQKILKPSEAMFDSDELKVMSIKPYLEENIPSTNRCVLFKGVDVTPQNKDVIFVDMPMDKCNDFLIAQKVFSEPPLNQY